MKLPKCSISPVAVREVNALRQGDTSVTGQRFDKHTVSATEVLSKAVNASEFAAKRQHYRELNQKAAFIAMALARR